MYLYTGVSFSEAQPTIYASMDNWATQQRFNVSTLHLEKQQINGELCPPHTHTLCGHFAKQNILDVYLNQIAADTKLYSHGNYNPEVESLAPEPNKQLKSREHNTTQRTEETKVICLEC